jgi:hypothetical protein
MRITATIPDHGALVTAIMEGFVQAAMLEIAAGVVPPFPSNTNVKFVPEPDGQEEWMLPHAVVKAGGGDCEDLAFWHCGGLRVTGEDPNAQCVLVQTGKQRLHCIVQLSDGSTHDPSEIAKLNARRRKPQRAAVGADRTADLRRRIDAQRLRAGPDSGVEVHDHRGADVIAAAAAAGDPVAQYMQQTGRRVVATDADWITSRGGVAPTATSALDGPWGQQFAAKLTQMQAHSSEHGLDPMNAAQFSAFGRGKRSATPADVQIVQDDVTGDVYGMRPDPLDKAAWAQGISKEELLSQLQYEQQFDGTTPGIPYPGQMYPGDYFGGYPTFNDYGGYPNPYGGQDYYGGMYDAYVVDPSLFYGGAVPPSPLDDLGVDDANVIDVNANEVQGDDGEES